MANHASGGRAAVVEPVFRHMEHPRLTEACIVPEGLGGHMCDDHREVRNIRRQTLLDERSIARELIEKIKHGPLEIRRVLDMFAQQSNVMRKIF